MHSKLRHEDIDDLLNMIRSLLGAAVRDRSEVSSQVLAARTHQALLEMYQQLEPSGTKYFRFDADLENIARICAYYAESAKVLRDELSLKSAQSTQFTYGAALSEHVARLFGSFAYTALSLSRSKADLQLYANQGEAAQGHEKMTRSGELQHLLEATIRRYEQGTWRTAAQAARQITPEIVELSASLANRRMGKPLLRAGTNKPLEWIRRYQRSKL